MPNISEMGFADLLPRKPVIYEVVPPRLGLPVSQIERRIADLESVLNDKRIDALNVPELMDREGTGFQGC